MMYRQLLLVTLPFILLVVAPSALAQTTLIILHTFSGSDGAASYAPLVQDRAGNLYGTTAGGGVFSQGTVFRVDPSGNETVLYSFTGGADGGNPHSGVSLDAAGNLYGITASGGITLRGVVFELTPDGRETVLHALSPGDGSGSASGLIRDASGNFYGTTEGGGAYKRGVVFKLDALGNYSVLHSFGKVNSGDGKEPFAGLVRDAAGDIFGTTFSGGLGVNAGTVFKVDASGNESVLYRFNGGSDGLYPTSRLVLHAGSLYGTTDDGGAYGRGTVFKVSASGKEKILHSFGAAKDGAYPFVGLVKDRLGNFYGVTDGGGAYGHGSVFQLDDLGNETVLYSFTGGTDGARPEAALWRDAAGNLYGTTLDSGAFGFGTVFELTFP